MKNVMPYIYLLMGFLVGFMVGAAPEHATGFPLHKLGYDLVAVAVILLYMWFERTSHNRHLSRWQSHRTRGRFYFVLSHYIVARTIPILSILILLINPRLRLTIESIYMLIITACLALAAFVLLGYQEWATCEADFSVQAMKDAAQRLKETGSDLAGGGV